MKKDAAELTLPDMNDEASSRPPCSPALCLFCVVMPVTRLS